MQIKSVVFNKGDFLYTIEYFDGRCIRKVATNEEPLKSLPEAVQKLSADLKVFLPVKDNVIVTVNSVRYGKNADCTSVVQATVRDGEVIFGVVAKIRPIGPQEEFPPFGLAACNDSLKRLWDEVNRYVSGEHAQGELDFSEAEEKEDDNSGFLDFDTEIDEGKNAE